MQYCLGAFCSRPASDSPLCNSATGPSEFCFCPALVRWLPSGNSAAVRCPLSGNSTARSARICCSPAPSGRSAAGPAAFCFSAPARAAAPACPMPLRLRDSDRSAGARGRELARVAQPASPKAFPPKAT
eukprot:scaffold16285_cov85-Isochrysis_galbana.AAC.4